MEEEIVEIKESYNKPMFLAVCVKFIIKVEVEKKKKTPRITNELFTQTLETEMQEEKEEKAFYMTFRVSKFTSFKELRQQAIDYWVLISLILKI